MKRLLLPVIVCALALGLASQALADPALSTSPGPAAGPQAFTCLGKVAAVDQTAGTITVSLKRASIALQGSVGQMLVLTVTGDSVISTCAHHAKTAATLADVSAGDFVVARGTIDATNLSAPIYDIANAVVWRPAAHARFLCKGTVSSVDLQAGALVVLVRHGSAGLHGSLGKSVTVYVPSSARIFSVRHRTAAVATIAEITAGDRVSILGRVDRTDLSAPVFTASCVFVRHVAPVDQIKWFACLGQVSAVDQTTDTMTVSVKCGTRAVRGDVDLTLTVTAASVMRTFAGGAVSTVTLADVQTGESIVAKGSIDRSDPNNLVYDVGHAFVWQPASS
jgi:hypothetical protein